MSDFEVQGEFSPVARVSVESADIKWRALIWLSIGIALTLAGLIAALWGLFLAYGANPVAHMRVANRAVDVVLTAPLPRLQPLGRQVRVAYDAREAALLSSFGHLRHSSMTARIPVSLAMALLAAGAPGLPKQGGPWQGATASAGVLAAFALQVPASGGPS